MKKDPTVCTISKFPPNNQGIRGWYIRHWDPVYMDERLVGPWGFRPFDSLEDAQEYAAFRKWTVVAVVGE